MKFFVHNDLIADLGPGFLADLNAYDPDSSTPAFRFEVDTFTDPNYTERPDLKDWDDYYIYSPDNFKKYRNLLISQILLDWTVLVTADRQLLVRRFVYPSTETTANLDLLYTQAERDDFQKQAMELLDETSDVVVRRSNVSGSTKFFDHQTNDVGTLVTVEIKTDVELA